MAQQCAMTYRGAPWGSTHPEVGWQTCSNADTIGLWRFVDFDNIMKLSMRMSFELQWLVSRASICKFTSHRLSMTLWLRKILLLVPRVFRQSATMYANTRGNFQDIIESVVILYFLARKLRAIHYPPPPKKITSRLISNKYLDVARSQVPSWLNFVIRSYKEINTRETFVRNKRRSLSSIIAKNTLWKKQLLLHFSCLIDKNKLCILAANTVHKHSSPIHHCSKQSQWDHLFFISFFVL